MFKRLLPLLILLVLGVFGALILGNPPQMDQTGQINAPRLAVRTQTMHPVDYQVRLQSYGTVAPRTQSMLVAQVTGQIVGVQPSFRPGGVFSAADELLTIDPRDYQAQVKIAEGALMEAIQAQAQEAARAEQAQIDWQRLGGGEAPSDLVLRRPQLQAAEARVTSARAALAQTQLNLERTVVRAPFDGRVLHQLVDVGQVVNNGAQLAEIYATDYVEIRLPLRNSDLSFVDLPESGSKQRPQVRIRSELGGVQTWTGAIVRTEGAIDRSSRQLHVVAQVNDPFGLADQDGGRPLKIGEYVTAEIAGRKLPNSIVAPSGAIHQNAYAYVVEAGLLQRRAVQVAWQNGVDALIASGLAPGDALVVTPLGQVSSGTPVQVETGASTGEAE